MLLGAFVVLKSCLLRKILSMSCVNAACLLKYHDPKTKKNSKKNKNKNTRKDWSLISESEIKKKKPKPKRKTHTPDSRTLSIVVFAAAARTPSRTSFGYPFPQCYTQPSTSIPTNHELARYTTLSTNQPTHTTRRRNRAPRTEMALVFHVLVISLSRPTPHPSPQSNSKHETKSTQSQKRKVEATRNSSKRSVRSGRNHLPQK